MMSRAKLYEQHAKACVQAAHRIDNADDRAMLLKIARQWIQEAKSGGKLSRSHTHLTERAKFT
jgi:hypothetical protein